MSSVLKIRRYGLFGFILGCKDTKNLCKHKIFLQLLGDLRYF